MDWHCLFEETLHFQLLMFSEVIQLRKRRI